jgi:hypothetical protein
MNYLKKVIEDFNYRGLLWNIMGHFNFEGGIDGFLDSVLQHNPSAKEFLSEEFNRFLNEYIPELDSKLNLGVLITSAGNPPIKQYKSYYQVYLVKSEERILRTLLTFCNIIENRYPEEYSLIRLFHKIYQIAQLFYLEIRLSEIDGQVIEKWEPETGFTPDPNLLTVYPELVEDLKKLSRIHRTVETNSIGDSVYLFRLRASEFHSGYAFRWGRVVSLSKDDLEDFEKIEKENLIIPRGKESEYIRGMIYDLKDINSRLAPACRLSNKKDNHIDKKTLENLHELWTMFMFDRGINDNIRDEIRNYD